MMVRFSRVLKDILHHLVIDIDALIPMNIPYPLMRLSQTLMVLKQK